MSSASGVRSIYLKPVHDRPGLDNLQRINTLNFFVLLNFGLLLANITQFLLLPFNFVPTPWAQDIYQDGIRYTKGALGSLLILITQWCGPSKLVLTFEDEGQGRFSPKEIENMAVRDKRGNVVRLNLPQKAVVISNHQIYADWWYAWCLFHFTGTAKDVYIVLKQSLKWIPIVGWGMQFFRFIFLARSWESDRKRLSRQLAQLGKNARDLDLPLSFLFFPEGTVVSRDTRPRSRKFAEREGIPDMVHTLIPRSTGLQYILRTLSPRIPKLDVIDLTIAYPGIPPKAIPQEYYTLRSIFGARAPPPVVHIHVRRFRVARDIPIGDLSGSDNRRPPRGGATVEVDVPPTEKRAFEDWLRALWREKDELFEHYYTTGRFAAPGQPEVVLPLRVRGIKESLDAFCCFIPLILWRIFALLQRALFN